MSSGEEGEAEASKKSEKNQDNTRRNFLRAGLASAVVLLALGVAAVTGALTSPATPPSGGETTTTQTAQTGSSTLTTNSLGFPEILVANISDLEVAKPISFNYPLEETPNILVKLGVKAEGGVGPDGDIVAFSMICQHLGCIWGYVAPNASPSCDASYQAPGPVGYCCCHGSVYDLVNGAKVVSGPSPRSQPQVILAFDSSSGNIYATGMSPPTIFGHNTGSNDVTADLTGGTPVA